MIRAAAKVKRGEVYMTDLDPVIGHEQGGRRPFLLISIDPMNGSPVRMVIGAPLTTTDRGNELHVRLEPGEGGLDRVSYALPEMVRSVSRNRLHRRLGRVSTEATDAVAKRVGLLIGLGRTR